MKEDEEAEGPDPRRRPLVIPLGRHLGQHLRAAREEKNVPLEALAEKLRCATSSLYDYETGQRLPPKRIVEEYESALGSQPGSLVKLWDLIVLERGGFVEPFSPKAMSPAATMNPAAADVGVARGATWISLSAAWQDFNFFSKTGLHGRRANAFLAGAGRVLGLAPHSRLRDRQDLDLLRKDEEALESDLLRGYKRVRRG